MSNKMKELAGIFGVDLEEEFKLKDKDGIYLKYSPYHFTEDGLVDKDGEGRASNLVMSIIKGYYTIEKVSFTPKDGEEYWTYYIGSYGSPFNGRTLCNRWDGSPIDKMNKLLGIVFKTEQEAKDYLPTWKKKLEGEELD